MDFVSLKFCYGGEFKHLSDGLVYVGGQQHSFAVDPDELCWWYLKELVVKCDEKIDVESIYYLTPNCGLLDGLRKVYHDNEVMEMAEIAKKFRSVDLFVVCVGGSTPNSTQNDLAQDISKPNRPPKLTPKRAPKVTPQTPTRKSPRDKVPMKESNAPVQSVVPPKSPHVITNPNHTSKSSQQHSKLPKPTVDPQISPQNILPETTSEPQPEEDPPECVTQEKLHKNTAAEVFTVTNVPENYEWEDPRPNSPIPFNDLIADFSYSEDETDPDFEDDVEGGLRGEYSDEVSDGFSAELEDDLNIHLEHDVDGGDLELDEELEEIIPQIDTSDEEIEVGRERVRGYKSRLVEETERVQKEVCLVKFGGKVNEGECSKNVEYDNDEIEADINSVPSSGDEQTVEEGINKRSLLVGPTTDFSLFKWKVGQRFATKQDVKDAVAKYGILQGRNVCFNVSNKNRQKRLGVKCDVGCPFKLWLSWDSRRAVFVVKTVVNQHNCLRNMKKNKQLKASWLAQQLLEVFNCRPHWPAKEMIEAVRVGYKANITNFFAYKVKMLAHRKLHGSMKEHYNKVGRYLEALKKASPGTIIELVHTIENNTAVFQRLFLCFEGLIKGWKEGCRRVICIDGCFLKTFLGGQLMAAVGRDGNDQMYPIAWAVVEGENKLSWEWFLTQLQRSLDLGDGKDLVIVSDENPAILSQVAAVLPKAEHRHCARHIFVLWHKAFKGEDMKNKFWNIAMSYNEADYNDVFAALEEENAAAAVAFKSYEPKVFCRAFCSTSSKADVITSNMVETFNNWIINSRTKHLIYMLEEIRASLMQRIVTKREEANKWNGDICPRIQVKLEKEKDEAAKCEVIPSSYTIFQVNHHLDSLSVDLDKKGCTCKKWDSTGIPCCHAVAAIFFCHKQPEDYISPYYTKEVYLKAYSTSIPPIEGERHWPTTNLKLDPPHVKIGPGRPRKNRMKSPHENPKKPGKLTKHGMEMTCTICKVKGHNKRRCPCEDTATKVVDEPQPKRHRGRPRSVSLQVEHTQHTPTSTHHESIAEPSRVGRNGRIMLSRGRGSGRGTPVGRGDGGSGNGETPVGGRGRGNTGRGRGNTGRGRGNTGRGKGNGGTNYMNQGSSSNAPTTRSKSKK